MKRFALLLLPFAVPVLLASAQVATPSRLVPVGMGYSATSVNTVIFRASSLTTHGDTQYIAYYGPEGYMTLGSRQTDSTQWNILVSPYKGNVNDAHNDISIGVDGEGYVHAAFNHHGNSLNYCRSAAPGSLRLGRLQHMDGVDETDVTYPEFYNLANGDLLFAYRSGASGCGNLVLKRYELKKHAWHTVQPKLIDGENLRNAYWQLFVDKEGTVHVSWVWRESWLVETNHDLCYACSHDNGLTWQRSDGTPYTLPITAKTAERICDIPQGSELINQTSMTADDDGHPYIATYWRDADSQVPQYRLVWHDGSTWRNETVSRRRTPFSLAGGGTKMIPISRPRLVCDGTRAFYLFRDAERGSVVSMATTDRIGSGKWKLEDLTSFSVDAWEPTLDQQLWTTQNRLHLFVQETHQGDGETLSNDNAPTLVQVLEVDVSNRITP